MDNKLQQLKDSLLSYPQLVIAFSGGLDSTFLTFMASQTIPGRVLAVTLVSPLMGKGQLEQAQQVAHQLAVEHQVLPIDSLSQDVKANSPHRCYYCKQELFGQLRRVAQEEGIWAVVQGANVDDLSDYRPGEQAAREQGIPSPLQEVGLKKEEIRALSRKLGLSGWDEPATVCLASRIRYGLELTPERLQLVEEAEDYLQQLGSKNLRLRIHDPDTLRLEVEPGAMDRVLARREEILDFLGQWDYSYLTLDLMGFQSGSMNRVLEVTKDE